MNDMCLYGRSRIRRIEFLPVLFCVLAFQSTSVVAGTIRWDLVGVQFTDGTHATGSFDYNVDTNSVSNIDIVTALATYTSTAPAFPIEPFDFVFVPSVPLVFGAKIPALVLFPSPTLTDAGGSVALSGANSFSGEGLICDNACDAVITSHQTEAGTLTGTAIPEPSFGPLLSGISLFFVLHGRSDIFRKRMGKCPGY
jgi:hypothetical protein